MAIKKVNKLVFENGTSSFNVLGLTTGGEEVFATVPMTKMVEWNGLVGYKPWDIPGMMLALISKIEKQGYQLAKKGKISIITRQHDILPVDERLNPLTPITSWQNNNTNDQSQALDIPDITSVVGPIAPRLGLAKIERMRALDPTLAEKVSWWTVSGDWIAMQLTGERFTSISDALGNLFVNQDSRELAVDIFEKVGLNPDCFAPLLENGEIFGTVKQSGSEIWPFYDLARKLLSWEILATKGDNPAAALIIADTETMVLSGGSSGPASRLINWPAKLAGKAACFDGHSGMRMPLTMLDWCALRYNAFIARTYRTNKPDLSAIDVAAFDVLQNHPEQILFVKQFVSSNSQWRNRYPSGWQDLSKPVQTASMLSSIAYEMSVQAKGLLNEASDAPAIKQAIIIGGMGRSKTFQAALHVFLLEFITGLQVNVIDKPRPLDTQAALLGAMNELLVADNDYPDIAAAIAGRIPLKPCINPADLSFLSMQDGFTKIE